MRHHHPSSGILYIFPNLNSKIICKHSRSKWILRSRVLWDLPATCMGVFLVGNCQEAANGEWVQLPSLWITDTTPHLLPPAPPRLKWLACAVGWCKKDPLSLLPSSSPPFFFSLPTFYFYPCSWGYSSLSCLYDGNTVTGSCYVTLYNSAFSNITLGTWHGLGVSIQSGQHNKSVPPLFPNIYQHKIGLYI